MDDTVRKQTVILIPPLDSPRRNPAEESGKGSLMIDNGCFEKGKEGLPLPQ